MKTKMIVGVALLLVLTACTTGSTGLGDQADDELKSGESAEPAGGTVAGTDGTPMTQDDGDSQNTPGAEPKSGEPSSDETQPVQAADTEGEIEVAPTTEPPKTPQSSDDPLSGAEFAVADLADRIGVATADVSVVSVEEVTWSDASLGCPQPGMSYTQALVDGSRVILEVGGVQYEYHAGPDGILFYCADPEPPVEDSGYGDT